MSIVPAIGNGDIRTVPTLWDGQTDNKASLDLTINNLQEGDLVEVTLTQAGAGCFGWTCTCRTGNVTFLASPQGIFTGENPTDLGTLEDRSWMVLLQSNAAQSITIGVDHAAGQVPLTALSPTEITRIISSIVSGAAVTPGYRISNVTLAAGMIGKTYTGGN